MIEKSGQKDELIPLPITTLFLRGNRVIKSTGKSFEVSASIAELYRTICSGGATLNDLAARLKRNDPEVARRMLEMSDAVYFFPMKPREQHDIVIVDQGFSGVTVATQNLWRHLNGKINTLLVSLLTPPFLDDEIEKREELAGRKVTFDSLIADGLLRSYVSYYMLLRTLLKRIRPKLLLFTHRCEAGYFFDIIREIPTIIYSDFFHEEKFSLARQLFGDRWPTEEETRRVLESVFYNIEKGFLNTPANHVAHLQASWYSLRAAGENWCWSKTETDDLQSSSQLSNIRFVGPSIDLKRLDRMRTKRPSKRVLFVSTMPNLHHKGLDHVLRALPALEKDTVVTLVTRIDLKERLPNPDPRIEFRQSITKSEAIDLYHDSSVYVRVAEEDTLPLSLVEAMACGLPVVVSPQIQRNFPGIEDGVTGFVLPTEDRDGVGRKLRYLLDNPQLAESMGQECRRRVEPFSVENHVNRIQRFLDGSLR